MVLRDILTHRHDMTCQIGSIAEKLPKNIAEYDVIPEIIIGFSLICLGVPSHDQHYRPT